MDSSNLFSKGFPTNRIPVKIPSTGQKIVLRETTVVELKSMCKIIIDNFARRQMNVIYDAVTEYLQKMILTEGVDVCGFTELDRLYCLMVFFQMSFYKEPIEMKCPHCGTEINYRYDMAKYLPKIEEAYVDDQTVTIQNKQNTYEITIGWPSVKTMSLVMEHFYEELGEVTEDMERTQLGINFILSFIKKIRMFNALSDDSSPVVELDMADLDDFQSRLDCINELPSLVVFDDKQGLFGQITGFFINRLENCFSLELCPQCHRDTQIGLSHSSLFYSLFYGTLQSIYGFILQVECLMVFRYDQFIFNEEQYITYNDLTVLVHQLSATVEKDNKDRQKIGGDNLYKGLWYIREILNTLIFPEDRKHSN